MTVETSVVISSQLVERRIRDADTDGKGIEEIARIAFVAALDSSTTWLLGAEHDKFRAGVGGLLLFFKDDDAIAERLNYELRALAALSAATSGLPIDMGQVLRDDIEPIGLLGIFKTVKADG